MRTQVSLIRPATVSSFSPSDGTPQLWITSADVNSNRMLVSAGKTTSLSTVNSRGWPAFSSSSGTMTLSNSKPP